MLDKDFKGNEALTIFFFVNPKGMETLQNWMLLHFKFSFTEEMYK